MWWIGSLVVANAIFWGVVVAFLLPAIRSTDDHALDGHCTQYSPGLWGESQDFPSDPDCPNHKGTKAKSRLVPTEVAATRTEPTVSDDQAVIVSIKTDQLDWDLVMDLEEKVEDALAASGVGELDGNDVGQGEYNIYMYGPDADRVWEVAEPVISASGFPIPAGSSVLRRYGDVNDDEARVVREPYPQATNSSPRR